MQIPSRSSYGLRSAIQSCGLAINIMVSIVAGSTVHGDEPEVFFEAKIRPLLVKHCYACHSEKAAKREGGLLLDRRDGLIQGGDSGPAVVLEKPAESLLIHAIRRGDDVSAMPPKKALTAEEIRLLEHWVEIGLPDPRGEPTPALADPAEHWAFQAPRSPDRVSLSQDGLAWSRGRLDGLMWHAMSQQGVTPSPTASPHTLVRRLAYDLTGLPPTDEMLRLATEAADFDTAYRRLVEDLLSSPRFGERWARYWLDLSRYADTKGYVFQEDRNYKEAYRYRDWVIQSINSDLPYDQFITRQLAADRLFADDPQQLAAMGFLTLGRRFLNNIHDIIDDRIDVVSRGVLGLTVSCARCHDHKYDPIPTQDYYSLYSVFYSSDEPKDGPAMRLVDRSKPRDVRVFLRGQPGNSGEIAPRGFVRVLSGGEPRRFQDGSGRLELAHAIVDRDNPLTARVFVNRVWGRLFGKHLVDTPSDFGVRTAAPAHVAALDYLAVRLMDSQWSVKALIREIVLSSAYRQSSASRVSAVKVDPENLLFGRMHRRRLDLEAMRDTLLSVAGQLDAGGIGGPSVDVVNPAVRRRTLYAHIDRQNLPSLFRTFDFAGPDTHNPKRPETTVPQQALFLMNSDLVIELAERAAATTAHLEPAERLKTLYRKIYGREISTEEQTLSQQMLAELSAIGANPLGTWQYGYGKTDDRGEVTEFHRLPHFSGAVWQGGATMPDPVLGWVSLRASGGHPGGEWHAIRRWVAPADGKLKISGAIRHPSKQGDGVHGFMVAEHAGVLATAHVKNQQKTLEATTNVRQGEKVDFIVAAGANPSFDSFRWQIEITEDGDSKPHSSSSSPGGRTRWDSAADFGSGRPSLDPWVQLTQVLLMSNELLFLD